MALQTKRFLTKRLMNFFVCVCLCLPSSTWLLDVQFAQADAVDELGGFRGAAVRLDQQVFVEVADPAAGLQLGVGGRFCTLSLFSPVSVQLHQVLQRAAVCSLSDRRKLLSARLLVPGNWTDGDRWRT